MVNREARRWFLPEYESFGLIQIQIHLDSNISGGNSMKVGIVGAGLVGSTAAYTMALEGAASNIVLVDIDEKLAGAQAEDILHATPHAHATRVQSGDYSALDSARVVILACGVGQKEGESRMELLGRNAKVFENVIPRVVKAAPDAVLVVASNPVDIITQITTTISGLPSGRVIGSGTILDTARFRSMMGSHFGISSRSIHAYVVGEHGPTEVLVWSSPHVGGVSLAEFAKQIDRALTDDIRSYIDNDVRNAAARIIDGKGATYYGIGGGLSRIVRAIRDDEGVLLTVSSLGKCYEDFEEVCFSVPRIVGGQGIVSEVWPALSEDEHQALCKSVSAIAEPARELGY